LTETSAEEHVWVGFGREHVEDAMIPRIGRIIHSQLFRFTTLRRPTSTKSFISPVLLNRARSIAGEHAKLSTQNAENYDVATAKKIGELSSVTAALAEWDTAQNVRAFRQIR
jgi:hypothetical protein